MPEETSLEELLEDLRKGDNRAANEIVHRFGDRLVWVARSRLDRVLARRLDPEDVVQSACRTVLMRLGDGRLKVSDWNSLWRLLVCITVKKCAAHAAFHLAAKRDPRREVDLCADSDSGSEINFQLAADEPTPLEATIFVEAIEQLLDSFRDEKHWEIVSLRLQHYSPPEIALEVGVSERTVHRVLDRVKALLQRRLLTN
jgi:RNA polymerase sigma factor (sigma-70 family)